MGRARLLGLCCLLGLSGLASNAGAQTVTDERVWFTLTLQSRTDRPSPWQWSVENILRTRDGVSTIDTAAFRPILNFRLDRHSTVGGGYTYAEYSPATIGLIEHRAFQHYVWTSQLAGGTLNVRERLEERFIDGNSGMAARLRSVVRYGHPIAKGSKISLVGYDELFLHLNTTTLTRQGVDQNRAFAGVSDTLNRTTRFEVGYLNQFAPGHGVVKDRMNHVLAGTLAFSF